MSEASLSPFDPAPPAASIVAQALKARRFLKRRYAWVAQFDNLFLKIPRVGDDVELDAVSPAAQEMAKREFDELALLADLNNSVVRPTALIREYSCLVLPRLQGSDLRPLLLREPESIRAQHAIRHALMVLAHIHKASRGWTDGALPYPPHPPGSPGAETTSDLQKAIIIEGFEIRNFFLHNDPEGVWFYDPHLLSVGFPEQDVARFVLSLLMLNWSRSARYQAWTRFSLEELLAHYEQESGVPLDRNRLRHCFRDSLELRFTNAGTSIAAMPVWLRPVARIYRSLYFKEVQIWAVRHEL